MAKRDPRLTVRGNTYYVRVKVPEALRAAGLVPFREFKKSLGTSNLAEARRLLPHELIWIDAEIAAARRKLEGKVAKTLSRSEARGMVVQLLHTREVKRLQAPGGGPDKLGHAEAEADAADWFEALKDPDDDEARNVVSNAARRLLENSGIELDTSSPEWRDFLLLVRRAYVEEARRTLREIRSDFSNAPGDAMFEGIDGRSPLPPGETVAQSSSTKTITFSEVISRFRREPDQLALSPKSTGSNVARDKLFNEFFGADTPVAAISRQDVAGFVELLLRLPPNLTKKWPGLTGAQAAEKAAEAGIAPMGRLTAKAYLSNLHTIFEFAADCGYREDNPAKGRSVRSDGTRKKDRRRSYSPDQLRTIFNAPLFTGCMDDERDYSVPGPNHPRRGRFWVPLLALLHGFRLNEACQLYVTDVTERDGVPVILIRTTNEKGDETEKRVKTEAGERFVPVHPEAVKMGFIDYVSDMRRAGHQRLFPELKPAKATGFLSDVFSKWYARFIGKIGAKQPRTDFHSFRHTYRDALREADISAERVRALGGWASKETSDDYGDGAKASTLAREMAKVVLPVDLSHLYKTAPAAAE